VFVLCACVRPINYRENRWGYFTEIWCEDAYGQYDFHFCNSIFWPPGDHHENQAGRRLSTISCPLCNSLTLHGFSWNLHGWCIRGQWCVAEKNRVAVTIDLEPVTLKPKFPSALYLLNECKFLVDIWCEDVSGYKAVSGKRCRCDLWPWPSDHDHKLHNISLPFYNS
jgi:hypothetical protein